MENIITGTPIGPRVLDVKPMDNFLLFLTFNNGEKRIFDAKLLFEMQAFRRLKDKLFFNSVKVARGSVLWPNDIDYCPDTLYAESVPADNQSWSSDYSSIAPQEALAIAEAELKYKHDDPVS